MISGGVSVPGSAGLVEEAGGGLVVVAEGVRDDGSGHLKELLSDGGAAGGSRWDADLVEEGGQVVGAEGLARLAAGEQPGGCLVGGSVHVVAVGDVAPRTSAFCQKYVFEECGLLQKVAYRDGQWIDLRLFQRQLTTPPVSDS